MPGVKTVVFAGERFFRKFPDNRYFVERVAECGARFVSADGADDAQFVDLVREAVAVVVLDRAVDRKTISAMRRCRLIMTMSIGYDCVDVAAATEYGIAVSNCPVYCTDEVATHAVALMHVLCRKTHLLPASVVARDWYTTAAKPVHTLVGATLGIVGLGRIGREVARKTAATGMRRIAYDPYLGDDVFSMLGVERVSDLEDLIAVSDYVTIHAPLTTETRYMIDDVALSHAKPGAFVINTARGPIVDEAALLSAVRDGRVAGAAVDVLEREPPSSDHPFFGEPRIVVTPHIAWYSEQSYRKNQELAMDELTRVIGGRRPQYIVNPDVLATIRERTMKEQERE